MTPNKQLIIEACRRLREEVPLADSRAHKIALKALELRDEGWTPPVPVYDAQTRCFECTGKLTPEQFNALGLWIMALARTAAHPHDLDIYNRMAVRREQAYALLVPTHQTKGGSQ